ncbi:MAG: molecular chaperone HtpG [Parachlamydiales bacterium]
MTTKALRINTENLLPIIKKWLYSDRDIFVRELVSNGTDALSKLKILREQGESTATDDSFRIEVAIDKEGRTLTFTDTGLGMDAEEVERYIGDVAFSGAEEFAKRYQAADGAIIGHFGLGFFSAFMVAERVVIETLSYKPDAKPVRWESEGSSEYTLEEGSRTSRGTQITLHLDGDSDEFLSEERIGSILGRYCAFLPYPIFLGETLLNKEEPLWLKSPAKCTDEDYKHFYRTLYPFEEEPLFWIHLSVDFPFHLQGILYFPRLRRDFDFKKETVRLFCNRVFVADSCKELLPDYLTMLRGVIDSPDIPLNVSRSTLQVDRTVRQLSAHISKKVADKLASLHATERERYLSCWEDLELIVKLGALQDEKFYERVADALIFKTTDGEWTTLKEAEGTVFYTGEEREGCPIVEAYKERGCKVLQTGGAIDAHLIPFLEKKLSGTKLQRIDGALDEALLDKGREQGLLDAEGKTPATRLAELVKALLPEGVEVEAKSLASDKLPSFLLLDEQARRMRDILAVNSSKKGPTEFIGRRTFVVNTNNPLMGALPDLHGRDPTLAKELVQHAYDQALLSQREMDPSHLDAFLARSSALLQKLALAVRP